ncbi:MAG: hypothetical protein HN509_01390 [Halobacteriovoraceae bacterium]|jgi:hypothetical protein|nr:hypothetical protein [Halobacteriovoraceae bacterium]MBT5095504.1 hypothetical protein [Halobacteriovoraceae bacterium]
MFYLKQYIKINSRHPLLGAVTFLLALGFVLLLGHRQAVETWVFKKMPSSFERSYFHALVSGKENQNWISRKLKELPGVHYVQILGKKKVEGRAKNILKGLNFTGSSTLFNIDFSGLKVIFKKNLALRSQNLIRNYLSRLVGAEKLTLGATKDPDPGLLQKSYWIRVLREKGSWGVTGLYFLALIGLFYLLSVRISRATYLVGQFQRRENVFPKTLVSGISFTLVLGIALSFLLGPPSYLGLLISAIGLLSISLLALTKQQWNI